MDKYEFKVRIEEIDKLMDLGEYFEAAKLADEIKWQRVKSVSTLLRIAELYRLNKRFDACRDILLMAYDRNPSNKSVVYGLCEIALELGEVVESIEYFKEYAQLAPKDNGVYILKYKIYEAQNIGFEERIDILEQLKKKDRIEEWEYELAYLYHRAGFATKCVEECDEITVWFGDGPYVIKAMELKMLHEPLSPKQQEKYDRRNEAKIEEAVKANLERGENIGEELDFKVKTIDMSNKFNTINLQAELAENVKEYLDDTNPLAANQFNTDIDMEEINVGAIEEDDSATRVLDMPVDEAMARLVPPTPTVRIDEEMTEEVIEESEVTAIDEEFAVEETANEDAPAEADIIDESEIFVPNETVGNQPSPVFGGVDPNKEVYHGTIPADVNEIFFADKTQDIRWAIPAPEPAQGEVTPEMEAFRESFAETINERENSRNIEEIHFEDEESVKTEFGEVPVEAPEEVPVVEGDGRFDRYLSQESDGQITMAGVDEVEAPVEKQITGQLSLSDILTSWEETKRANKEKMEEQVRQRVLAQTGQMFSDFDMSTAQGILASLEAGKVLDDSDKITEELLEGVTKVGKVIKPEEVVVNAAEDVISAGAAAESVAVENVVAESLAAESVTAEGIAATETAAVLEQNPSLADEKFYGAVTDVIPGAIWNEVKQYDENKVQDAYANADIPEVEEFVNVEEAAAPVDGQAVVPENTINSEAYTEADESVQENVEEEIVKRSISKEARKLFAQFLYSKKMKAQIIDTMDRISLAAYAGNVIITSESLENGVRLAKAIIKYAQSSDGNFSGAVAKIGADHLNHKDVGATLDKLLNGALIIENAADLDAETVSSLLLVLNQEERGIIVFFVDKKVRMRRFIETFGQLKEVFTARIDIVPMNVDALVDYGVKYALKEGYAIDDMALLAFYKKVSDLQVGNHSVSTGEVKSIIDGAISNGKKKGLGSIARSLSGKKYDDDDHIILREKDFR